MKKYANKIALICSNIALVVMVTYAWPIFTEPQYSNIAWMAGSAILLIFFGFYKLLSDILREIL